MLTGVESVKEGINLCNEVTSILKSAGFDLQKWASNSQEILDHGKTSSSTSTVLFGERGQTKTLGLYWSCEQDFLMYQIDVSDVSKHVTKRTVLSVIAKLYDPLGLVSPCLIIAKIIMQRLWLPLELASKWNKFKSELLVLNELKVPRHILGTYCIEIQIHGFSDASTEGYGACVFVRSVDHCGTISVHLVCGKSKVAPLKVVTIPRLELCAALLLAKLVEKVRSTLTVTVNSCFLWRDSTVALSWIHTPPNTLQTFVGNRVTQIQALTSSSDWRHIRSASNPADLLSRGVYPSQMQSSDLWWNGPPWLSFPQCSWPKSDFQPQINLPDLKKQISVFKVEFGAPFSICKIFAVV
ncbi:uncharacterized protein LOC126742462 [Anthonomus grandis grandis]|uniref:uncharacterized protein LOC126742462 n=1 Tax=Anthonomus grandis grandis TaxID=2921223 RepID=UPI00216688AC|nr:uncharacterized protein LOC126742462 [Anthonomus grandis grandis]